MNIKTIFLLLILSISVFAGCTEVTVTNQPKSGTDVTKLDTSQELKKFNSVNEIIEYIQDSAAGSMYYGNVFSRSISSMDMAMEESVGSFSMSKAAAPIASGGTDDFSQTNVQVKGVDEADFVKNDGKYIYVLSQDKLVIVDAYPADDAEIISETEIEGRPANLFVNDDKLVVFSVVNDEVMVIPQFDFIPRQRYTQVTHAYVYDISDREEPELVNDFNTNGQYYDARMIDDYVYFISKESLYYRNNYIDVPVIREGAEIVMSPEIYYFDNPEQNFVFHTIAAFDIDDDDINAKSFMMGYSNTLMVSKDNIYISYQKNLPWRYYENQNEDRFYDVVVPLLPADVQDEIEDVKDSSLTDYEKWQEISSILEDMYNSMDEKDKRVLVEEINDAIEKYEVKRAIERSKTIIHKIAIDGTDIDYVDKGEVNGYLLNQFSMDEYQGNLRVATTTQLWTGRGSQQHNNVYVLDEDMDTIGELEEIAPDERIYSTRFVGDRLYMVTFKRIDPLFVIDLSDPEGPSVLGELKIPGYSDYLHPYDENHIIGIGKETSDNQWGGISVKGVKLALFDVSDVTNPELLDKYEIGEPGTDSEALREHKAFLFDKKKNVLVIPIREVKGERYRGERGYYMQRVWQGAYVFGVTPEDGFEVKGKISHNEDLEETRYYWNSPYAVKRSLYMDDILYTISAKKILMNDLDDIDDEINSIKLPYKQDRYYPVY
jgi:uncharacterized secreted protein with C-terminal beta-propeller domain